MIDPPEPVEMLTFSPMIDSECSRRILQHYGIRYQERDRLFGWVSLLAVAKGGYGRVPLVRGAGWRASGPRALVGRLDSLQQSDRRLLPPEQPERGLIEQDVALFNDDLAADVAAIAYYHLLPERDLMIESFGKPITPLGRRLLPAVYPALASLFRVLLRLRPERIADAALRVEGVLSRTDDRVRDGRRFLHAGRLTFADVALASAIAPLLLPPAYSFRVPEVHSMPTALRELVRQTRARPSGAFASRLYEFMDGPGAPT